MVVDMSAAGHRRPISAPIPVAAIRIARVEPYPGMPRFLNMQTAAYYLEHAEKAERLALFIGDEEAKSNLEKMAHDYRDIAQDLENGAIDIRHPELMPQSGHSR
jgi:hypothetical protein